MTLRGKDFGIVAVLAAVFLLSTFAAAFAVDGPSRITCNPKFGHAEFKKRPRTCIVAPPREAAASWAHLKKLRWRGWGSKRARFRGKARTLHAPFDLYRVRGVAFRVRPFRCGGDYAMYTRIKIRSRFGTRTIKTDRIC